MPKESPVHIISGLCPTTGGPAFALDGLVRAQHDLGMSPKIVATYTNKDNLVIANKLIADGLDITLIGPCYTSWRWFSKLQYELEKLTHNRSVLHLHGVFEAIQFFSSNLGIPYVLRPCGLLSKRCLSEKKFKKKLYLKTIGSRVLKNSSLLHCVSNFEKQNLGIQYESSKIVSIGNGHKFCKLPKVLATNQSSFLFVGRILEIKRLDILIRSLVSLPNQITLKIVGPDETGGRLSSLLLKLAHELKVDHRIEFLGELYGREKEILMSESFCLALASEHENFSNVAIESLANGTPVVLSSKVALAEEVCANKVGLTAELNAESFAKSIQIYSEINDETRLELSKRCSSFVEANFSWKTTALKWQSIYQSLEHP